MKPSDLKKIDALVIGAGFAGLSTAWHLSKKGLKNIVVVEHDRKLGSHASGRNAGMIRQALSDPVIAALAAEGRRRLSQCGKMGWKGSRLASNGSLLLASGKEISELKRTAAVLTKEKIAYRWFTRNEAVKRVPMLSGGDFEKGLFCDSDAMVDIALLLRGFYKQLIHRGVPVWMGHTPRKIEKRTAGFYVTAGKRAWITPIVVNATGAWASAVAHQAKASCVPLKAYRRHLFISKPFRGFNSSWPFVWDLTHNFYFRPQDGALLLSPCDKEEIKDVARAVKKETTDPKIKKLLRSKLEDFGGNFKPVKIQSAKSGLRTMTPDGRFVIGEDPKLKGFFWVAALGGHGVTTSFAVGDLASDLILGKKRDKFLVNALSPRRFVS